MAKSAKLPRRQTAQRDQAEALLRNKVAAALQAQEARPSEVDPRTLHELQIHRIELELQNEELRQVQVELSEVKARYHDLFDRAPAAYFTLSDKGLILEANQTAATLLGLERGTLLKKSFSSCVFPEDTDTVYLRLRQVAQTGGLQSWEVRMVRSDGTLLWVLLQASAAQDAQRGLEYRIILNDLTASRKTQDVLLKLSTAVEQSPTSIVITDLSGAIEYVNPKFTDMTGYALTEVLGKTPSILKSGYSTPEGYQELWETISAGRTWHGEFRNRKKNGDLFWEDAWISPVRDAQGVLVGYVGVKEDITERKHAEAVLRESEAKWRALFEILPVGLSILDDQHGLKEFNPALTRILQIDPEALRRGAYAHRNYLRADGTSLPWEELPSVRAAQEQAAFRSFEIGVQTEGGDLIWTEVNAAPLNLPGYSAVLTTTDITERKRIEDALRTRETMLARTEAIAHVGSWERDMATGNVIWSDEMFRILQRDPAAGTPTFEELANCFHPEDMAQLRRLTDIAVQEGTPFELELRVLLPEGETRTCLSRGHAEAGPDGKAARLFGSLLDITRSKQLENGLRHSEADLIKAQRFAKIGSWTWHIKSNRLDWSDEMYGLFGIARETFTGALADVVDGAIHPDDREAVAASNRAVAEKGTPTPLEYRILLPDGTVRYVWAEAGEMILDEEGRAETLSGIVQDITERRMAEQALRESEARFASMAEHSPVALYRFSQRKGGVYYSPPVRHLLGYTPEELLADPTLWHRSIRPWDVAEVDAAIEAALVSLSGIDLTYRISTRDGQERWFRDTATCRLEPDGDLLIDGVVMDITERKWAEISLRESNDLLSRFISLSPIYAYIKEATPGQSRVLQASENFQQMIGIPGSEMVGKVMPELFPAEIAEKMTREDWAVVSSGEGLEFEEEVNGRKYYTLKFPIIQGERLLMAGFSIDITEREEASRLLAASREQLRTLLARLQRAQEDERIQISRLVHDELGQLLTELKLDLGWLERRLSEAALPPELTPLLDKVMETTELADTTIQTVQRLAEELRPNTLESLGLVASLRQEARRFEKHTGIPCATEVEASWPELDPSSELELFYICREALTNAARHSSATRVSISLRLEGAAALIDVIDDGVGMTEAEWIESPSLGLLGMRERAAQIGGTVAFHPNQPCGTCMTVSVPWLHPSDSGGTDS
jgi:PAS domain S-box-containing protein